MENRNSKNTPVMRGPLTLSTHDIQLTTLHIQHATGTFDIRHTTCNSQHSIYNIPYTTCHGSIYIQKRGAGAPFFFARELPALSPRSTFRPLGGGKVERFSSPAVLRRCCPLSSERVACCQSPRESRGAASVLPFFRGRAEEVARWQCLRDWAQAAGHVTSYFMGGPYVW